MILSHEQLLVDIEVFRMCRKAHEGITVADDRWLIDVLEKQGPGGHFLSERSTTRQHAQRRVVPARGWVCRLPRRWTAAGRPTVHDGLRQRVDELLATHVPLPLGDDVERELEKLRQRAAKAQ